MPLILTILSAKKTKTNTGQLNTVWLNADGMIWQESTVKKNDIVWKMTQTNHRWNAAAEGRISMAVLGYEWDVMSKHYC